MKKTTVTAGILLAIMLAVMSLQGCLGLQRAAGCNNPGILGCKDKGPEPSEIERPPAGLKRAPESGRTRQTAVDDLRYPEGLEYPWSQPLETCMTNGITRTECFLRLPPDILAQFQAWEAEKAAERRQQLQGRATQRSLGLDSVEPTRLD